MDSGDDETMVESDGSGGNDDMWDQEHTIDEAQFQTHPQLQAQQDEGG